MAVGTGTKTFTVAYGNSNAWATVTNGMTLKIEQTCNGANFMQGTVTSVSGTTLTMNITSSGGSGTHGIWIVGSIPTTTIINNAGAGYLFEVAANGTTNEEIAYIKFQGGSGTSYLLKQDYGTTRPIFIHDCWFDLGPSGDSTYNGNGQNGIIWNCSFTSQSTFSMAPLAVHVTIPGYATSWTTASTWGTADTGGTNNFYVENSDFHGWLNASDFDDNSRWVWRWNIMDNAAIGTHGPDTSNYGQRHGEVYDNTFRFHTVNGEVFNLNWWFLLRGGSLVVYSNIIPALSSRITARAARSQWPAGS